VGSDPLHQHLLSGCDWLLPTPVRFRSVDAWAELVRQGVLDAALISGLELNGARDADTSGLRLLELGSLPLELAVASRAGADKNRQPPTINAVLVPHRGLAPGLHHALLSRGLRLRTIGNSCSTPEQWLERLADGDLAMPIDPASCNADQWASGLLTLPMTPELRSPLWLLLPRTEGLTGVLTWTLEHLS